MADYREYNYDEVTAHQIEADIREAEEIEKRAEIWREKRGEELVEQELTKEIESNLEDLALEKQMSPEILAREKEIALSNLKEKEMTPEEISDILNRYASNAEEYLAHGAIEELNSGIGKKEYLLPIFLLPWKKLNAWLKKLSIIGQAIG